MGQRYGRNGTSSGPPSWYSKEPCPRGYVLDLLLPTSRNQRGHLERRQRREKHNTKMARELIMPYLDNNDILQDIGQAIFIYDQYIKDGDLQGAAEMLKCSIAVLADCFRVCRSDFLAADTKGFRQICRTTFKLSSMLAHARLKLGRFDSAIKCASYAMQISPLSDEYKADILRIHGEDFAGLARNTKAL